jgi:hypothetical protein
VAAHAAEPGGGGASALAVEWFTAYAEYLKRAAGQSASTIELYQQITDKIVRGDLAPTATQDLLAPFLQARGTAYSDELAQLNVRFFREMVRIGTAYAHELGQAVLPESAIPPAPPPAFDPSDPTGWFEDLSDYSQRLGTSMAATYQALVERAASGEVAPSQVQEAAADYLQRRLPEYVAELGRLYFELLNGLTELRVRSEQEFLTGVLDRANGAGGADAFELTLTAPLGETATASFSIGNTRDEPARIRCHVTEVRRADGVGPGFTPAVMFATESLELAPGDEARLELKLRLDEDSYEPDILYVAELQITGHGEPRLEVPLRITATRPSATTTAE